MKKIFSSREIFKKVAGNNAKCSTFEIRGTKKTKRSKTRKKKMKSDKKFLHHQARANNIFLPSYEFIIRKKEMWGPEGDKVEPGRRAWYSVLTSRILISSPLSRKWNFNQSNENCRLPVCSIEKGFPRLLTISAIREPNTRESNSLD